MPAMCRPAMGGQGKLLCLPPQNPAHGMDGRPAQTVLCKQIGLVYTAGLYICMHHSCDELLCGQLHAKSRLREEATVLKRALEFLLTVLPK